MIEIVFRHTRSGVEPYSEEDAELLKGFIPGQIVKHRLSAIRKPRSYEQLKTYFAACQLLSENVDSPDWDTKEKVDFQIRCELRWIKGYIKTSNGVWCIMPKSISYAELPHLTACKYFDRAFLLIANYLRMTVEELIAKVKERCGHNRNINE